MGIAQLDTHRTNTSLDKKRDSYMCILNCQRNKNCLLASFSELPIDGIVDEDDDTNDFVMPRKMLLQLSMSQTIQVALLCSCKGITTPINVTLGKCSKHQAKVKYG